MKHYIDKDALAAEIRKRLLPVIRDKHYDEWEEGQDEKGSLRGHRVFGE